MLGLDSNEPGDFDRIIGEWEVRHRRLKHILEDCDDEWVEFIGYSKTVKTLGGLGNVEDNHLMFPNGSFRAKAIRSFNPETNEWSIWWLDGRFPGQIDTPVVGRFEGAIGKFYASDTFKDQHIDVRFTWDFSDKKTPKWEQAFSKDKGNSWEVNWKMTFIPKS